MIHELKTWPCYFRDIESGKKTFEVRKNDRNFKEGDVLLLREWRPGSKRYTGARMLRSVTFVLDGGKFGIEKGHCVMAIAALDVGFGPDDALRASRSKARLTTKRLHGTTAEP